MTTFLQGGRDDCLFSILECFAFHEVKDNPLVLTLWLQWSDESLREWRCAVSSWPGEEIAQSVVDPPLTTGTRGIRFDVEHPIPHARR